MSEICMPYLRAIKIFIKDAFPNSKVNVWAENSMFDRGVAIKAMVDNDGAYINMFPDSMYTEKHIADLLITSLKERKANNETD